MEEELFNIRDKIENLNQIHHIKFFEIIKKYDINYSENRNGIFINMNTINSKILKELSDYILYINKQEDNLKETENIKNDFKKEFFKDNKDKGEKNIYYNNV